MASLPQAAATRSISSPDHRHQRSSQASTIAACEACRKQKMRCIRSAEPSSPTATQQRRQPCDRCRRNNRSCYIPERKAQGRKPGSLGRYSGVEKAVRQLTTQVRKATRASSRQQQQHRDLEEEASDPLAPRDALLSPSSMDRQVLEILINSSVSASTVPFGLPSSQRNLEPPQPRGGAIGAGSSPCIDQSQTQQRSTNCLDQDASPHRLDESVSNPLGLLADASGEAQARENQEHDPNQEGQQNQVAVNGPLGRAASTDLNMGSASSLTPPNASAYQPVANNSGRAMLSRPGYVSLGLKMDRSILESALDNLLSSPMGGVERYANYFTSRGQKAAPDTGPDVDPIELGLVSVQEAEYLFPVFFERLHPINGILDPVLHTPEFVRPRSALLFTWILAITAQFDHDSGSLAKRLRLHGERLSKKVLSCGYKSVEIAQGYYISLLAAFPANTAAEDHSWIYTNYTLGMVSELGLDRIANGAGTMAWTTENNTSAATARMDQQSHEARLLRNRERTWFRILLWERAQSAAHGKVTPFPDNELIRRAKDWWRHPLADPTDRYTSAFVLLRQHLASLYIEIKGRFVRTDNPRHWVRNLIDSRLDPWCQAWLPEPATNTTTVETIRQLFLRYVYMHGRLWTLSFALSGPLTNGQDDSANGTKDDCFEAAVHCCEVTIRDLREIGEPMYCLMAPTWAMSSYAAVLALKLFPQLYGDRPGQQVELLAMLAETAAQLEKAGTTPSHRFGVPALLGQHLFIVLKKQLKTLRLGSAMAGLDMFPIAEEGLVASGLPPNGQEAFMMDSSQAVGWGMEGMGQSGHMTQLPSYYADGSMLDNMSFGDAASLQDTFASMMRDWGGPPFDFEGVYD